VLDQLRGFFGYENVVPISTMNLFKLKSLVKDLSKFYGLPFEEVNAATRTVEEDVRKATLKSGDDKNLFVLTYDEAMQYSPSFKAYMDKYPQLQTSIKVLFKQQRSLGRHAGGVLIADDLPSKMPLITSGGEPQAPWLEGTGVKTLEKIGKFIKYDILGLETLRLIERAIEVILKRRGGIVEFELEGIKHRLPAYTKIKLTDGNYVSVDSLNVDDDVVSPLEILEEDIRTHASIAQ
jgi:DNA polymerase III alpha subunit